MISPRKLIKMAKKWQRVAALGRKRIALPRVIKSSDISTEAAGKGRLVAFTADEKRFVFPIAYLNNYIIRELFKRSKEGFGLPSNGPVTLPRDAAFMEYAVSLIQRQVDRDICSHHCLSTRAVVISKCSLCYSLNQTSQQIPVCGF